MERNWAGTTYGNTWMHTWLIRILRFIPIRALYAFVFLFVVPVCLVVNPANRIIYRYFRSRWGYGALKSALMTYLNFYLFGQVVVDRFAMYAGKTFDVEVEGKEHYDKLVERPEGFMILSAHVGNYEIAGYTLRNEQKRLNALVFAGEKASVMQNRTKMFAETNIRMIPIRSDMSHIFEINNALADGHARRLMTLLLDILDEESLDEKGERDVLTLNVTINDMNHLYFGGGFGATPDGRKAGEPLSENLSPSVGYVSSLTSLLNSVASLPTDRLHSGALNVRIGSDILKRENGALLLNSLLTTYFKKGGLQIQISVADTETLRSAQACPECYRDLTVRITGYSAIFVDMSKNAQDEIIRRDELAH